MRNLTAAAQSVLDASNLLPGKPSYQTLTAALRTAADCLTDATSAHTLYAIADELEQ